VTGPQATLAPVCGDRNDRQVPVDELISRAEVTAMLFTFADINANVERILLLLEGDDGEEEAPDEDT
jgi:hypothetical protein